MTPGQDGALGRGGDEAAAAGQEDVGGRALEHASLVVDEDGVVGAGRGSGALGQVGLQEGHRLEGAAHADAAVGDDAQRPRRRLAHVVADEDGRSAPGRPAR